MPFITQGKANIKYLFIVALVAAIAGGIIFFAWNNCQKEIVNLNNFTERKKSDEATPTPLIDIVSPNFGPIGTTIEIQGKNFSGFEGDLDAWIENAEGVKGIIYGETGSNGNLIKFTLKSSFCQTDTSYSGLPCSGFLNIAPGTYKIYVAPWGQKSNEFTFTVTPPLWRQ